MPRYKLTLEYDGSPFRGWQRQAEQLSVQGTLEDAVAAFCGETVTVYAAGRTDAGVHALGQVAHLDLGREVPLDTLRNALNYHLRPHPVVVHEAAEVPGDFHARFSARARHYRYRIVNRPVPLVLARGQAWFVPGRLDAEVMHEAASRLLGRHDFSSFRSSLCQARSPVKTLELVECGAERRRDRDRGAGALLPAPSGAQHGRHAEADRARQMAGRADRGGVGGARSCGCRPDRAGMRPLSGPRRLCGSRSAYSRPSAVMLIAPFSSSSTNTSAIAMPPVVLSAVRNTNH